MHDLSPVIDRELAEHRAVQQVLSDRVEVLERIGALTRQLDALTHRALAMTPDLDTMAADASRAEREAIDAEASAAAAAKPAKAPAKAKATRAKKAKASTTGPARPRRAPGGDQADRRAPAVPLSEVQAEVLTFLGSRDLTDPASATMIAEGIGRDRYCVDKAIAACNGQLAQVVERRGPKPALYLRSDQLPAECWPHTANEARAQSVPEWIKQMEEARDGTIKRRGEGVRGKGAIISEVDAPGSAADQAAEAERRRAEEEAAHAEREAERAAAAAPPISPRVQRELDREPQPAGEHDDVQPENLAGKVLRVLTDNGGMRVRAIADVLSEDPAVVARVISEHVKSGNIRKNTNDATYYAVGQLATA